jgi:hypothetical protein
VGFVFSVDWQKGEDRSSKADRSGFYHLVYGIEWASLATPGGVPFICASFSKPAL